MGLFWLAAGLLVLLALGFVAPFVGTGPAAGLSRRGFATLLLGLPATAFALYAWLGEPSAMPGAATEEQALSRHLQRQPDDARALVLQARTAMDAQQHATAAAAYARALGGTSRVARDAAVWVEYAEALGLQQGGSLLGAPQQALARALALDPAQPQALDLAGSAAVEAGDHAVAAQHWGRLLTLLPPGSERHAALVLALERVQRRARLALPAAPEQQRGMSGQP